MKRKLRVGILCGGKSAEHEVSLLSAKNIIDAIDTDQFEVVVIGIDKSGRWIFPNQAAYLQNAADPKNIALNKHNAEDVALTPASGGVLTNLSNYKPVAHIDVVFPILHGTNGEDGTVQGLLKLANVPFVGANTLGSAVGMDKDVMKRLLHDAGIPIAKFLMFTESDSIDFQTVTETLRLPVFVKPANLGSSVGVSKAKNESEFTAAVTEAFLYDRKILIEEYIEGRELECAVLGNNNPIASCVGEIIPHHEFYSYQAKYLDENGANLSVPANIIAEKSDEIRALAIRTFKTLACEGLGRVDFFLTKDDTLYVNEINTMPGFTQISMYPGLWSESGISYSDLITRLIKLAIERFEKEQRLRTSVSP